MALRGTETARVGAAAGAGQRDRRSHGCHCQQPRGGQQASTRIDGHPYHARRLAVPLHRDNVVQWKAGLALRLAYSQTYRRVDGQGRLGSRPCHTGDRRCAEAARRHRRHRPAARRLLPARRQLQQCRALRKRGGAGGTTGADSEPRGPGRLRRPRPERDDDAPARHEERGRQVPGKAHRGLCRRAAEHRRGRGGYRKALADERPGGRAGPGLGLRPADQRSLRLLAPLAERPRAGRHGRRPGRGSDPGLAHRDGAAALLARRRGLPGRRRPRLAGRPLARRLLRGGEPQPPRRAGGPGARRRGDGGDCAQAAAALLGPQRRILAIL
mmetsp:Transcript_48538/g.140635  ORF Transcript_48538/g.140635 Transcript_48538/m.140635 type:complete len:327 (+) Transcript_48538:317-1297(+)